MVVMHTNIESKIFLSSCEIQVLMNLVERQLAEIHVQLNVFLSVFVGGINVCRNHPFPSEAAFSMLHRVHLHMVCFLFLALLNHFVIRRGYVIPYFCVIRLHCSSSRRHHSRRKHFDQTLSPLKFMDLLASNFT